MRILTPNVSNQTALSTKMVSTSYRWEYSPQIKKISIKIKAYSMYALNYIRNLRKIKHKQEVSEDSSSFH